MLNAPISIKNKQPPLFLIDEILNLPKPAHVQGKSFLPLLQNPDQKWKEVALSQYPRDNGNVVGYSMRTEQYRYTRCEELSSGEFYFRFHSLYAY